MGQFRFLFVSDIQWREMTMDCFTSMRDLTLGEPICTHEG